MNQESIVRLPQISIELSEANKQSPQGAPRRIQLARIGKFKHENYGKFEITPTMLENFKKNFDRKVRGIDIAIDYKHENQDKAAGWFENLEVGQDSSGKPALFGEVKWTPEGSRSVGEKEFRYISPEFTPNYVDNETGEAHGPTLLGAGLTNRPFLKRMAPAVELSEKEGEEFMNQSERIAELEEQNKELKTKNVKLSEQVKTLESLEMSPQEMAAKIKELESALADARGKLAEQEKSKALAEKNSEFNVLLSEGKVVEAQREPFMKGDFKSFAKLAGSLNLNEQGHGQGGNGAYKLSEQEQFVCKKLGLTEEEFKQANGLK